MPADPFAIVVHLMDLVPFGLYSLYSGGNHRQRKIIDLPAIPAQKMTVHRSIRVKTGIALVNGKHLHRALLGKKF